MAQIPRSKLIVDSKLERILKSSVVIGGKSTADQKSRSHCRSENGPRSHPAPSIVATALPNEKQSDCAQNRQAGHEVWS